MITVNNVSMNFSGQTLFKDVELKFVPGNCYGIIGANGAGKSTFLRILSGDLEPTTGEVIIPKDERMSILKQDHFQYDAYTVLDTVMMGNQRLYDVMKEKDALYEKEDFTDEDGVKASELEAEFAEMGGWEAESDVSRLIQGLGLSNDILYSEMSSLTAKEKVKVLLAQALFGKPDIILLDEPTNHLDIQAIEWLEDFLMNNAKAVMVISHDKAFVDHITTRTIEIARGRIYDYKVNYSHYLELRRERREQQQAAYDNQQKMIAETREFIERFKGTYSKTNQVQSRVRMLEKLELIEVDEEDRSALNLRFPPAPRSGSYPVITSELGKAYGDHRVFSDVSITIGRGDKVAFVGRNGEGKSTMVKAIMGQIDFEGEIRIGHNVRIGYFAQNEASGLDESITVFKTVDDIAVGDIRTRIRDILGAFMFGKEASEKLVKVLSGGERTRLAMIKLLLEPVNLLILDEPTNHLDLKTKEILKEALMAFDGTLIVVFHDRDFLDGLTSKIYEFSHGRVTEHLDGVYGFLRKKKIENISEIERRKA